MLAKELWTVVTVVLHRQWIDIANVSPFAHFFEQEVNAI